MPWELLDRLPLSRLTHIVCDEVKSVNNKGDETLLGCRPATGSSAGSAAAVLVNAFRTRNASIGDRCKVPPSGGIIRGKAYQYLMELEVTEWINNGRRRVREPSQDQPYN